MHYQELYKDICDRYPEQIQRISEVSKEKNQKWFLDNDKLILNFDKLANIFSVEKTLIAKGKQGTTCSSDGLYYTDTEFLFIEFKDQSTGNVSFKDLQNKYYQGISVLLYFLNENSCLRELNISCFIICNPEKNGGKNQHPNPVYSKLTSNIHSDNGYRKGAEITINKLNAYFKSFAKIGLKLDFKFIFLPQELDDFLKNLRDISMTTQNFLVEIGTEELPPKALKTLATSFADNVEAELNQAGLAFDKIEWFAAPRRLAVKVLNLATQQPSKEIEKRGPAVSAAFDAEGKPTKAAEGWARGCGITVEQAERIATDKGEWLVHRAKIEGQPTKNLLNDIVANALAKLPIPKPMRWADKTVQFIRPVHTVTMLLGDELIEGEILGVASARTIRGHRFLGEKEFEIQHADQYPQLLREKGSVVADFNERKAEILAKSQAKATALGGVADIEESLLEEVTSLVEYPNVLAAKFEERFLAVPAEALVYTMKGDQKYFPIYDKEGKLLPHFIFVSNINPEDPTAIIEGNEKVVRPRLTDAEFFFKTDLKQKLIDRLPRLETVLFQQQLGTLKDKTDRIEQLAGEIAKQIGADEAKAKRAGLLSKCDLMTNMVFEFTDTQGVMGMHYARHDGEDEEVAVALNEQYMPRFAGDELPKSLVASAVALADKFDTLTGIFGIGQAPKGSADPFALRRAALGALRIIVEKNLPLDLEDLVKKSAALFGDKLTNKNVVADVVDFMLGRFRAWYQDEGIAVDVIQAVLARRPTRPADFDARVRAVSHFRTLDSAEALAAANKRVSNILAKADAAIGEINLTACVEPAEKALAEAVLALRTEVQPLIAQGDYTTVLDKLANLRVPVDSFFDNVMVNAEDPALRQNRLAILNTLQGLFLQVADISALQ